MFGVTFNLRTCVRLFCQSVDVILKDVSVAETINSLMQTDKFEDYFEDPHDHCNGILTSVTR